MICQIEAMREHDDRHDRAYGYLINAGAVIDWSALVPKSGSPIQVNQHKRFGKLEIIAIEKEIRGAKR